MWHRVACRIDSHQSRHVNLVDLSPPDQHQITWAFHTVNSLSEIHRLRLDHAFKGSLWNTWLHVDSPMRIRRPTLRRMWARVMRTCPLIVRNVDASQPSNHPSANRTAHIFSGIFSIKTMFSLYKLKFQLNREEIKRSWSKILSFLWSLCVLDSIAIIVRQDWSRIVARIDRNRPLNTERPSKKKSRKYSSIKANSSQIFTSIGLVMWFPRNSCNLWSLD